MKMLFIYAVSLFSILAVTPATAQKSTVKESIKVWGNCTMCKKKIERYAKAAGATTAVWNEETKELKVVYATAKTSGEKIQQAIAKSGYDTQDFAADTKAYEGLDACCQYDRKGAAATSDKKE